MLRVIVGTGGKKKRGPAEELGWEDMGAEELGTLASTPPLLGGARTFLLIGAFSGEREEEFLSLAKGLVASPHVFIFEEEKLLKRPTEVLKKAGAEIEVQAAPKKEEPFSVFALAAAFGSRDRKKLWILLTEAFREGVVPEAICGMLHWKVRQMLTGKGNGAYTTEELRSLSRELVSLYHDSHRGAGDLELLLERFALTL